jgi:hypothetical protein
MKNVIIGLWGVTIFAAAIAAHGNELDQAVALAHKTLEFVQRSRPCPDLAAKLVRLERRSKGVSGGSVQGVELGAEIRQLRRQILFAHPLLDFDRLLVNKCPPPGYAHQSRQYLGRYSRPGPGLVVLESWKDKPREISLVKDKLPAGAIMHPDLSFDARRIVFAFCDHTPRNPDWRQYFLWEINVDGSHLHRLSGALADRTAGAEDRETSLVEDFDPCYLPDGGIAFVSTRSQTHIRCQYGYRYFANFLLYRADGDGSHIRPLSFAEAPEWEPSVMDDGRILYSRWDYTNRHSYHFQSLWVTRPDGTGTANVYGNLTRNPCNTGEPRQVPGSHKIVCTATAHHGYTAGSIILVDPRQGLDGLSPITRITPEIAFPETEGWPLGAYATPFAISEDLFLAAYTPEQLVREGKVQSAAAYGIYLVDSLGGRELIYRDASVSCFSPIPIQPRSRPPVLPPAPREDPETGTGVFFVRNVYQSTHALAAGSVKSLRVVRVFPQTVETPPSRSITPYEMPKKILGTAPVNEDGSVAFRAPARQPLLFQLLDHNGMALMTMRSLVYLQPGETVSCAGCHEPRQLAPERSTPRAGMQVHDLQSPAGPSYEGGLSFARTVQPVLDRYCIGCHGLNKREGDLDLLGTLEQVTFPRKQWPGPNKMLVSRAYHSLLTRDGLVSVAHADLETDYSAPKDYYAHAGRLAKLLLSGHPGQDGRVRLTLDRQSFARIVDWLDANAVCYGDYSWNKREWREPLPEGERALREYIRRRFGPELAQQPFDALVNVALPEESRILMAPLAISGGGWGLLPEKGWRETTDMDYQRMRQLVQASIAPQRYHDINGTCGRDDHCRCDSCWVRLKNRQEHGKAMTNAAPLRASIMP